MTNQKFPPAILREAMIREASPVLLYDKTVIRKNFQSFKEASKSVGATFSFAVKAFAHDEVFEIASEFAHGFDISNFNEWKKVRTHYRPEHIVWFTNGKYVRELDHIMNEVGHDSLRVILNDVEDYKIIKDRKVKYLVRLCTSSFLQQSLESRFGISTAELTDIRDELLKDPLFCGFHIHQGVEDNNFEIMKQLQSEIKKYLAPFKDRNLTINFGGGFHHFSQEELLAALNFLKGSFNIHIEPGRAFFKNAGYALTPIEKFIYSGKALRIFTPLSFSAHLKWSVPSLAGVINLSENTTSLMVNEIMVEGPTCYEYDRIRGIDLKDSVTISDKSFLVLANISGYSREWNTSFNGIDLCDIKFFSSK